MRSTTTTRHRTALVRPVARLLGRAAVAQVQELRALATVGVIVPLGLTCRGSQRPVPAPSPAASRIASTGRPVVLVHGFLGTPSGWSALIDALRAREVAFDAISYPPFGSSVEKLAERLAARVSNLLADTGADKVHLVGHSLGGIIIAQAFADGLLADLVDTVFTIAAPFGGSPWANLLPVGSAVRALRDGSQNLRRIADAPLPPGVRWVAFTASRDLVAPGRRSIPPQSEMQTITIEDAGHIGLLTNAEVINGIVAALPTPERATA
jgi:triacylglycerol lipase